VQNKDTTIASVAQLSRSATPVEALMSRTAEIALFYVLEFMNKFQVLQLNTRKSNRVQQSLLNDKDIRDFGVLAISKPHL
jgi:hypothetical protein